MEEKDKEVVENSLSTLTKEEVLEPVKNVFKGNEESLKYIDSILNNLVELKKLEAANPQCTSLTRWILPILLMFTGSWANNQSSELLKEKEDEAN